MPRWRQTINPETGKSEFIPVDSEARRRDGHAIHGDIETFRSPIDGTVIADRKQYREHMEKHGVVPAAEFSGEFRERKAKERADFFEGRSSREETHRRKSEMYEIAMKLERQNGR